MVKVIADVDCGNAPKKQVLLDRTIAFASRDDDAAFAPFADDVEWLLAGKATLQGKAGLVERSAKLLTEPVDRLIVHTVMTHGDVGAVNGRIEFKSGSAVEFCNVYEFGGHGRNALIKRLRTYWVKA